MMQAHKVLTEVKHIRFITVGALNTLIDLIIYSVLQPFVGVIIANTISTSTGMVVGYILHRSYTFKATKQRSKQEALLFFGLTIFGQWILQPLVILLTRHPVNAIIGHHLKLGLTILLPKLLAIGVSMVWNYLCYNNIVFKNDGSKEKS